MNTPSNRLRAKLDLAYPTLLAHAHQLWSSPFIRELYPAYLGAMHMIVRSAVPLMESALEQARAKSASDHVAAKLVAYLSDHIQEESGHDTWLREDLEATGADTETLLSRFPSPAIATLVGAQYYWLRHHHPVSLLGHISAIESYPPPVGFANRLRELSGYPASAFRAISRHELLDIRHRKALYEMLDSLPLTAEHEKIISISSLHTIHWQIEVLQDIYALVVEKRAA